jgi:flagellar biosynthesis chaperone FliJ
MKRFRWPLQRVLDVAVQRERTQRAELLALTRRMARRRQEALSRQAAVRSVLLDLADVPLDQRLRTHETLMRCCQAQQRLIDDLEGQLAELGRQRSEKTRQLLHGRKYRQTLERLREEARQQHLREQLKLEQKLFDESAHLSKARKILQARVAAQN